MAGVNDLKSAGSAVAITVIYDVIKVVYAKILRSIIAKAVESTDTPWDNKLLILTDALFGYDGDVVSGNDTPVPVIDVR